MAEDKSEKPAETDAELKDEDMEEVAGGKLLPASVYQRPGSKLE